MATPSASPKTPAPAPPAQAPAAPAQAPAAPTLDPDPGCSCGRDLDGSRVRCESCWHDRYSEYW